MILAQNYPTSYLRLTACQRAHTSGPVAACDDHVMSEVKFEVAAPFCCLEGLFWWMIFFVIYGKYCFAFIVKMHWSNCPLFRRSAVTHCTEPTRRFRIRRCTEAVHAHCSRTGPGNDVKLTTRTGFCDWCQLVFHDYFTALAHNVDSRL